MADDIKNYITVEVKHSWSDSNGKCWAFFYIEGAPILANEDDCGQLI